MREEYYFSQSIQNPYAKRAKKQISLNIEVETIKYFKELSVKIGLPYQTLINEDEEALNNCIQIGHILLGESVINA